MSQAMRATRLMITNYTHPLIHYINELILNKYGTGMTCSNGWGPALSGMLTILSSSANEVNQTEQ